jgi:hypothetical protein
MRWAEPEILLLLATGDPVEAKDKRTGHRWRGTVDVVAPGLGKLWIYAELGERKLIDMEVHNISRAVTAREP